MSIPTVRYDHLFRLSDEIGMFEHARFDIPRPEHGYCVDDVARGLLVIAREESRTQPLVELGRRYLDFVTAAQSADGRFRNRRATDGRWTDRPSVEDCWGRALWGLGAAATADPEWADLALVHFNRGAGQRSPHLRAMAFAAMGAAEILRVWPAHAGARALLGDAARMIGRPPAGPEWPWPESRLRYANAVVPETLIAAGDLLGDARVLADGLLMLGWLVEVEMGGPRVSVTPVGGWAPGEPRPGFDQQPIEVAALADACARAFEITSDVRWRLAVERCASWFTGENDCGVPLIDPATGAGYDGLHPGGRNENRGAESTLAALSTLAQAQKLFALQR